MTVSRCHGRFQVIEKRSSKDVEQKESTDWFDDLPVIGKLPPEQAIVKLREVGEDDVADMLEMTQEAETKVFRAPILNNSFPTTTSSSVSAATMESRFLEWSHHESTA